MSHEQLNLFGLFTSPGERQKGARKKVFGHHPSLSLGPSEQNFYLPPERLRWRDLVKELQQARRSLLFFIEGGSGHGKTAFLTWLREMLVTQHFAVQYTSAIELDTLGEQTRNVSQVMLIDDLQDLVFYPHKQSLFCHAFDESKASWPPVHWIVTSAIPMSELLQDSRLSERIKQRLEGLHPFSLPTLKKDDQLQLARFWQEGLSNQQTSIRELSAEVAEFVAAQKNFNGHRLLALIERLTFSALDNHLREKGPKQNSSSPIATPHQEELPPSTKVTQPSAAAALKLPAPLQVEALIEREIKRVRDVFAVSREELYGPSRQRPIVTARFIFLYFLYQSGQFNKLALAKLMKKDHTSILYALEKMQQVQQGQGPEDWQQAYQRALCWSAPH